MTGYTDTIRRYAMDSRFTGSLPHPDGVGEVGLGRDEAGSKLAVRFTLRLEGERVAALRFQVYGCGFTIAACAAAAELACDRPLAALKSLTAEDIDTRLEGLPAERDYCAELALSALQGAAASAEGGRRKVQNSFQPDADHGPRIQPDNPVFCQLLATPNPAGLAAEDRQLFACLLAVSADEPWGTAEALGLHPAELDNLVTELFPGCGWQPVAHPTGAPQPPAPNPEIRELIRSFLEATGRTDALPLGRWLADCLAARAAHPGHLWVAMGLLQRPALSAAIRRHLPALAAANHRNMRWKRFLFKRLCDLNGGALCKTPDCGQCSDYALCFAPEDA